MCGERNTVPWLESGEGGRGGEPSVLLIGLLILQIHHPGRVYSIN